MALPAGALFRDRLEWYDAYTEELVSRIAERDVFNPARGGGEGPRSPARLRLWGVGLQGREARAVIEDTATHRQELYRVGDQVGGARIASIDWDRVTLEGDGGEAVLELSPPAAAPTPRRPRRRRLRPPTTASAAPPRTPSSSTGGKSPARSTT